METKLKYSMLVACLPSFFQNVRCPFPIFIIRLNYLPLRARFKSVFHSDYVTSNEIFKFPQKNLTKKSKENFIK